MMKQGSNQTIVRDTNMKLIFDVLMKESLSSSDLAKKLKLSKPALTKIMAEMIDLNLVTLSENGNTSLPKTKGRKKVYFTLNGQSGIVGIINFLGTYVQVLLADMAGEIIEEKLIEDCEFITLDVLNQVVLILKQLLFNHLTETRNLLSICIAAPGKINKHESNIERSPKFLTEKGFKLVDFFGDAFHVHVSVKNDINMLMISEINNIGLNAKMENALLLHVDVGVGGAIFNQNNIIEGDAGYAGEFGLIRTYDRTGRYVYYDSICSINSIKDQIKIFMEQGVSTQLNESFDFEDILVAFQAGDQLVRNVVLDSAKYIGQLVLNLFNIFNYNNTFISGRVTQFGDDYLNVVKENLIEDSQHIQVSFAELNVKQSTQGVIRTAINDGINHLLQLRKYK
jgi:predicted NBD/HSP70 family sugar kinase